MAVIAAPLLPRLVTVFGSMFKADAELPAPVAHIFYEKRVLDIEDAYPKHQGYLRSQLAFLKYLRLAIRA